MTRLVGLALVAVFFAAIPASARAESVIVLGIRSMEGDDEFALSLTGALRHGASQVAGWEVSDREVSLAQMALAHGCDDPDVVCMQQIAQTLGSDRVLYGTVRRTAAGADFDFNITLYMFNAQTGQIEGVVTDTIPQEQRDIDQFRGRITGYMARLRGTEQGGQLRIVGNVPGAEVLIDGERAGVTDAEGVFASDVASGARRVEVRSEGYTTFRGSITVAPGSEAELEVTLVEGSGFDGEVSTGGGVNWAGIGLLGLGAAAIGATVFTWLRLDTLSSYDDLTPADCRDRPPEPGTFGEYRCAVPENLNACDEVNKSPAADHGASSAAVSEADSVCSEASTLEILQYIFPVVAGLAIGGGILLLATGDEDEEELDTTLTLHPSFGPYGADVSATLRF